MVFREVWGGGREEETGGKSLGGLGGGKEKMGGDVGKKGLGREGKKLGKIWGFGGKKCFLGGFGVGEEKRKWGGKFGVSVSPYWLPLTPNS